MPSHQGFCKSGTPMGVKWRRPNKEVQCREPFQEVSARGFSPGGQKGVRYGWTNQLIPLWVLPTAGSHTEFTLHFRWFIPGGP